MIFDWFLVPEPTGWRISRKRTRTRGVPSRNYLLTHFAKSWAPEITCLTLWNLLPWEFPSMETSSRGISSTGTSSSRIILPARSSFHWNFLPCSGRPVESNSHGRKLLKLRYFDQNALQQFIPLWLFPIGWFAASASSSGNKVRWLWTRTVPARYFQTDGLTTL